MGDAHSKDSLKDGCYVSKNTANESTGRVRCSWSSSKMKVEVRKEEKKIGCDRQGKRDKRGRY